MLRLRPDLSWLDVQGQGRTGRGAKSPPQKNDDDNDDDDNPTHRNKDEGEAKSYEGTVGQSVSQLAVLFVCVFGLSLLGI